VRGDVRAKVTEVSVLKTKRSPRLGGIWRACCQSEDGCLGVPSTQCYDFGGSGIADQVRDIENILENSTCPLPVSVHSRGDAASSGGRGVAVFAEGDLGGISEREGAAVPASMRVCDAQGFGGELAVCVLDGGGTGEVSGRGVDVIAAVVVAIVVKERYLELCVLEL
jgi:hypothetical protein